MKAEKQSREISFRMLHSEKRFDLSNQIMDNRDSHIMQKKMINNIIDASESKRNATIQRVHIGYEPIDPDSYREITDITNDGDYTGSYLGGEEFSEADKGLVYENNESNYDFSSVQDNPADIASDESYNGLLNRDLVSSIEPEIDHIIPYSSYGSNTLDNARILSKDENNSSDIDRPDDEENSVLRAYSNLEIVFNSDEKNWNEDINAGDTIDDSDVLSMVDEFPDSFINEDGQSFFQNEDKYLEMTED